MFDQTAAEALAQPHVISARQFLIDWRDDDSGLPIPSDDFGTELAYAVDVLLALTSPVAANPEVESND